MRAGASTPLYEACVWPPRPQLVSLLLGHCSADSRTVEGGWTALMAAAEHDNLEALELLLEAGAAVDAADDEGRTALHWACIAGATRC